MSGGSYDYVYSKIYEIDVRTKTPNLKRLAFQKLLTLVAAAMHDIEWVDSGDYGEGDEIRAIDACFSFLKVNELQLKALAFDDIKLLVEEYNTGLEVKNEGNSGI